MIYPLTLNIKTGGPIISMHFFEVINWERVNQLFKAAS